MLQLAEEMLAVATKYNLVLLKADAAVHAGFARACQGETALGIAQIRQGLAYYRSVEERMFVPYALAYLVEIYVQGGQTDAAREAINEALAMTESTGEYFWYAELLRLQGEIGMMSGATEREVEASYQHALQITRQQQARSLELRVTMSLARLWQRERRSAEAYPILAEIYHWFGEGFDTADLQTAKALLTELQAVHP
jgi:predicted ATPase